MDNNEATVPHGYCRCGCGQRTPVWARNNAMRGVVKGEARRYCPGHYHRRDAEREFLQRVGAPDENGCWPWAGMLTEKGYGLLRVGGRTVRAHRFAYELAVGPIPVGLEPDHTCRNRACVNPAHLEAVTHAENSRRSLPVKLTIVAVRCIRERLIAGERQVDLAAEYGVAAPTISAIKHRRIWRDVE